MKKVKIRAFHLKKSLDLSRIKLLFDNTPSIVNSHELLYSFNSDQYFYVVNYGAIVFFNFEKEEAQNIISKFNDSQLLDQTSYLEDSFELVENPGTYVHVEFDHLILNKLDNEAIKISLLNMAQSIALSYFDQLSQELLAQVKDISSELEVNGKLSIKKRHILKWIGKLLNTKNHIAENLYIFDAPPITWENEYYNLLNITLSKHFELNTRYRSIENNLKILEDNLHVFLDVSNHRESSKLEWIIIILILVEVVDTFIGKLL